MLLSYLVMTADGDSSLFLNSPPLAPVSHVHFHVGVMTQADAQCYSLAAVASAPPEWGQY